MKNFYSKTKDKNPPSESADRNGKNLEKLSLSKIVTASTGIHSLACVTPADRGQTTADKPAAVENNGRESKKKKGKYNNYVEKNTLKSAAYATKKNYHHLR